MDEIFLNLSTKFIINLPVQEQQSLERLCFQVEAAHWYYEDFIRELEPSLPSFHLKQFSQQFFKHCPILSKQSHRHEKAFADFIRYKTRVPVCGAIILNQQLSHCLLVKGWKQSSAWSFPKGKINLDEAHHLCAVREVLEETGFDCSTRLVHTDYIDVAIKDQKIRLYIIQNVPMDTPFKTQTRKEISKIEWFKLTDLPSWKRNSKQLSSSKFYLITPFIGRLKSFIKRHKPNSNALLSPDNEPTSNPIDSLFSKLSTSNVSLSHVDRLFSQCTPAPGDIHAHNGSSPLQILQHSPKSTHNSNSTPSTAPLPNLQPFPPPLMPPKMPPVQSNPPLPSLPSNASTNVPINFVLGEGDHVGDMDMQRQMGLDHRGNTGNTPNTPSHHNIQHNVNNLSSHLSHDLTKMHSHSQLSTIMHPPSGITNTQPPQNLQQTLLESLQPLQGMNGARNVNNVNSVNNTHSHPSYLHKNDPNHKQSLLSLLSPQQAAEATQTASPSHHQASNPLLSLLNTKPS
ncbi:mRNA decapping complex subunit 2 [Wallemia ichthyophaga EXF-994]|uniref:mRNA decapping complex subunit 2 n=1 Tax=Wallemia ichthyophaga (strain EXF-994 / CBS 113033) TaxID=1299270 RepID=R9AH73_WALI9|nr:mRNA decapping complex subunit 2 [Wallemia ichthyophaga EXF-994]TIA73251.1 hypothetical protein E3P91_01573 [Wallemia ichthyophaga]EOR01480.1 mRNA decapping complex subunit 2 [Wallemia ichthyophaga EXF-994]TIA82153.1 hypothetical protein E3P98_01580 [Wallemia ichthyophaga]TIA95777.1 hypothetical protein E3P96_03760 [Wallemia ichthyophaga]TIB34650.1 hypothetical protein E3P84_01673 [Wallemia ichthyophaga]